MPEERNQQTNLCRCGNCGSYLDEKDKYCKCCGSSRELSAYSPSLIEIITSPIFYGPPVKRKYRCKYCNYTYNVLTVSNKNLDYCPKCGNGAEMMSSEMSS